MNRRQFIAVSWGVLTLGGCTGGGLRVSVLAGNEDDETHTVTAWVVQGDSLEVANTVTVAPETTEPLGKMGRDRGDEFYEYRVTVKVDGELTLAEEFHPEDWFTTFTIMVESGGSVKVDWSRSGRRNPI